MKKYIIVVLAILLMLSGCHKNTYTQPEESKNVTNDPNIPFEIFNFLCVYQTDGMYRVVINENETDEKSVEFSADRECLSAQGLNLIKTEEIGEFLGKDWTMIEAQLGKFHVDVGSGFYIPSYITEDGYLISFWLEKDDKICQVMKRDLITGTVVQCLDTY